MINSNQELLEIYKLHAELADRVSQRRDGANRTYSSLLTALLILAAALVRFGPGQLSLSLVLSIVGIFGVFLSISWYLVLHSYRQLNRGKIDTLIKIEEELAFPFFKSEWDHLKGGGSFKIYWKLTSAEKFLPVLFLLFFMLLPFAAHFLQTP